MRVLVCGDVNGRLDDLFKRIRYLNNSSCGRFDALFCTGKFLSNGHQELEAYLNKLQSVPIPTYFFYPSLHDSPLVSLRTLQDGDEVCTNLIYLGRSGIRTILGLAVGFVSKECSKQDMEVIKNHTFKDGYLGVDILLTNDWAQGVHNQLPRSMLQFLVSFGVPLHSVGNPDLVDVTIAVCPRYHFAASHNIFFQRLPYRNFETIPLGNRAFYTRFISLGTIGTNQDKNKKWLHAIDIQPLSDTPREILLEEPPKTTKIPYLLSKSKKQPRSNDEVLEGPIEVKKIRLENDENIFASISPEIEDQEEPKDEGETFFFVDTTQPCKHKKTLNDFKRPISSYNNHFPDEKDHFDPNDMNDNQDNRKIFVGGVKFGRVDIEAIRYAFSRVGEVTNVCWPQNKDFCFVEFNTHEEAQTAVDNFPNLEIRGCRLRTGWSKQNQKKQESYSDDQQREQFHHQNYNNSHLMQNSQQNSNLKKNCWFCLSSPDIEAHLITSVGGMMYLAQPKGSLVHDHILIIPIHHLTGLSELDNVAFIELKRYKNALLDFYDSQGSSLILFERNIETKGPQQHMHLQVIPVPINLTDDAIQIFKNEGLALGLELENIPTEGNFQNFLPPKQYFFVEIQSKATRQYARLLFKVPTSCNVPLQFGREVVARLLNIPHRAHWKACVLEKEREEERTECFKKRFNPFDFTLN